MFTELMSPVVEVSKPNGDMVVISHIAGRGLSPSLQPLAEAACGAVAEAALTAGHAAGLVMHQPASNMCWERKTHISMLAPHHEQKHVDLAAWQLCSLLAGALQFLLFCLP